MDFTKPVSGRELARLTGTTEGAVRKAVERGSIFKGLTAEKKFIPSIASLEWGKEILKEFRTGVSTLERKTKKEKPAPAPKPAFIKKEKPEPQTAAEVIAEVMSEKLPAIPKDFIFEDEDLETDEGQTTKPEAERIMAITKAEILKIALKEKKGELIDRAKIAKILFSYGQETRVMLEGIPDRVIDKMRSVETRHEQKRILSEEIYSVLEALSDIPNRNL